MTQQIATNEPVTIAFVGTAPAQRARAVRAFDAYRDDPRPGAILDRHGEVFDSKVVVEIDLLDGEVTNGHSA